MERDRRSETDGITFIGQGESYRPRGGGATSAEFPPDRDRASLDRNDSFRRDDRREAREKEIDSYIPPTSIRARSRSPGGYRRRSRSPAPRGREDSYPPRRYSPRRDDRARSPPRRRSRSPYDSRQRSSPPKRARDYSPDRRSPPIKRERYTSPDHGRYDRPRESARGGYRTRSRTPPRRDAYEDEKYRRRSPSPRRSRPDSTATSRRSSPPVHAERASMAGSVPHSSGYQSSRNQYDTRPVASPAYRDRDRSPPRSYPDRTRDEDYRDAVPAGPTAGPNGYRNGYGGANVPSRGGYGAGSPPAGPGAPMSMSAHNRPYAPNVLTAPTRPRGAPPGRFDGPPRDFSGPPQRGNPAFRGGPPRQASYDNYDPGYGMGPGPGVFATRGRGGYGGYDRGRGDMGYGGRGRGGGGGYDDGYGRGCYTCGQPGHVSRDCPNQDHNQIGGGRACYTCGQQGHVSRDCPNQEVAQGGGGWGGGARGGGGYQASGYGGGYSGRQPSFSNEQPPPFRMHNNSSSTTYPRTQRFNPAAQIPTSSEQIVDGGRLLPSGLGTEQEKRMKQLEEDAEKLRMIIDEKQKAKREALREWEIRERESSRESLKSELTEAHLNKLTEGDEAMGGATF